MYNLELVNDLVNLFFFKDEAEKFVAIDPLLAELTAYGNKHW